MYTAPAGVPKDISTSSVNLTNITIHWDSVECSQRNGEIGGYRLVYYPTTDSSDNESVLIDDSNSKTFTIVGLQPRTNYTLRLEAVNTELSLFGPDAQETVITTNPDGTRLTLLSQTLFNSGFINN